MPYFPDHDHDPHAASVSMGMTRRDMEDLKATSVRDADRYLAKENDESPTKKAKEQTLGDLVLSTLASGAGAGAAGFLSGFTGTILPAVTLAALAHGLGYWKKLGHSEHLHKFGEGALDSAIAIWSAGQGALVAEKRKAAELGVATGTGGELGSGSARAGGEPLHTIAANYRRNK